MLNAQCSMLNAQMSRLEPPILNRVWNALGSRSGLYIG